MKIFPLKLVSTLDQFENLMYIMRDNTKLPEVVSHKATNTVSENTNLIYSRSAIREYLSKKLIRLKEIWLDPES